MNSADLRVIGVDPGPTPGLVLLDYDAADRLLLGATVSRINRKPARIEVMQSTPGALLLALPWLIASGEPGTVIVQTERFVVGARAGKVANAAASAVTRDLVGRLQQLVESVGSALWVARTAADVKPWATDERLDAVGLLDLTRGMRHARDGARHALYCARHDGRAPDPLSKR